VNVLLLHIQCYFYFLFSPTFYFYFQNEKEKKTHDAQEEDRTGSLYEKLKENLEVARDLTDILKREKWRLSRREMSVELRMGELEEYKSHLKRDMVHVYIVVFVFTDY